MKKVLITIVGIFIGYIICGFIMECMNAGMNGHIAKPIDVKLVIKEIRRISS